MKHICKICEYETTRKENYERHLLSKKHKIKHKNNIINNKKSNITDNTNIPTNTDTNTDTNTYTNTNTNNIVINKIVEVTNTQNVKIDNFTASQNIKIEELCKKIELLEKSNQELKNANNQNTNKIVKEARAIKKSILTILNTNFKDTPSIDYIKEKDFRKELESEYKATITDKDDKLFKRIFLDYEKKKLVKTLGDIILKFVKKEDQKSQPVFNIDSARGNYATKIENYWLNDKKGLQLKKYTLDVIVGFMCNVMNVYRQQLVKMYNDNKVKRDVSVTDYIMKYQGLLFDVNAFLTDSNVHKKIIIYMCPELRIDDKVFNAITNGDK